jgi:hypothetical protein
VNRWRRSDREWVEAKIDRLRLEFPEELEPLRRHGGTGEWDATSCTSSNGSEGCVECATKNNAAYILSGNWEGQTRWTKSYLRDEGSSMCQRVVHNGEWRNESKNILGYRRQFAECKKREATRPNRKRQTGPGASSNSSMTSQVCPHKRRAHSLVVGRDHQSRTRTASARHAARRYRPNASRHQCGADSCHADPQPSPVSVRSHA